MTFHLIRQQFVIETPKLKKISENCKYIRISVEEEPPLKLNLLFSIEPCVIHDIRLQMN